MMRRSFSGRRLTLLVAVLLMMAAAKAARADMEQPAIGNGRLVIAQATVPPTGMTGADKAMSPADRMARRFPQPVRVADLIGLPVLDQNSSTLGTVRAVVRTRQGGVELIVCYGGWFGWGARLVAVPIEVVGIEGRLLRSLDMPPAAYADAPPWRPGTASPMSGNALISVALARN